MSWPLESDQCETNPWSCAEPAPREIRNAELRKDRAQAHLVIGFRGLTVADPDRVARRVVDLDAHTLALARP